MPEMSEHFKNRKPNSIRIAQIEFIKRTDRVKAINAAIGNVSLPMYPAMTKRMLNIKDKKIRQGVVDYTPTSGTQECKNAFLNVISASGFETKDLYAQVTNGGSEAMELVILGTCSESRPLMLIDPAYTNYKAFAKRLKIKTVSVKRRLNENGLFELPDISEIENTIKNKKPGALVIIPYDNPTGQFYNIETMKKLAYLCVKYDIWMVSDEAYRELYYTDEKSSSIWALDCKGRRISIESTSKIWNACGLRIGAIVTDNKEFSEKTTAEYTINLSPNTLGQYIFGALEKENKNKIKKWFEKQRKYYKSLMFDFTKEIKEKIPGIIISNPSAAMYSVIDMKNVDKNFDADDFVLYCAQKGSVNGKTLLVAPMSGFYDLGKTQMRIAYVLNKKEMKLVPLLFKELFEQYKAQLK